MESSTYTPCNLIKIEPFVKTRIIIIGAFGHKGQVGLNNDMAWNLPAEMRHFRETTKGHTVIMGRKTHESIGRPLPKRRNIVISSTLQSVDGVEVCRSFGEAITLVSNERAVFVIGGPTIWMQAKEVATHAIISEVYYNGEADCFMPEGFFTDIRENYKLEQIKMNEGFSVAWWQRRSFNPGTY